MFLKSILVILIPILFINWGYYIAVEGLPLFNKGTNDNVYFINALIVNNSIHLKYTTFIASNTIDNGFDNTIIDIYPVTEPSMFNVRRPGHNHKTRQHHNYDNDNNQYLIYEGKLILQYNLSSLNYECIMNLRDDQQIAEFIYLNKRHYYNKGKTMLIYCNDLMCKKEKLSCNVNQINKKIEL